LMEPIFAPIGCGWQMCIALIPAMAAREVAVAALATVYSVAGSEDQVATQLVTVIGHQWSLATAVSMLVWFVFAPQCISTLATVKRETGSWRYVGFMLLYLFGLAYGASFLAYQGMVWLG